MRINPFQKSRIPLKPSLFSFPPISKNSQKKVLENLPRTLSGFLKQLNLPQNPRAFRWIQSVVRSESNLSPKKIQDLYQDAEKTQVPENLFPLMAERGKGLPVTLLTEKMETLDLAGIIQLFLFISQGSNSVFLPLDQNGGFVSLKPGQEQIRFSLHFTLPGPRSVYFKGWMDPSVKKGEGFFSFYPDFHPVAFTALKTQIQSQFPGFLIYLKKDAQTGE